MTTRIFSFRSLKTAACITSIITVMLMTVSCGQKGPLRVPEAEKQTTK